MEPLMELLMLTGLSRSKRSFHYFACDSVFRHVANCSRKITSLIAVSASGASTHPISAAGVSLIREIAQVCMVKMDLGFLAMASQDVEQVRPDEIAATVRFVRVTLGAVALELISPLRHVATAPVFWRSAWRFCRRPCAGIAYTQFAECRACPRYRQR